METIDSAKDDSVSLMISNPKMLDCCACFQPLTIPVFQCDNGHIVCSTCHPKLNNKCHECTLRISSKHCKAIENLLLSIEMSCPNTKYGCREKISYLGKRKHEEECIHEPYYCPFSGCDFVASSEFLSNHFNHEHGYSQIKFSYGHSFDVSLKSNDETIVLQEENDAKLFILHNSTTIFGNAVIICCIGPNFPNSEYSYDILASTQKCTLKLQSFAKNVKRFNSTTLSSNFLMIPSEFSKPLRLQICINPNMSKTAMEPVESARDRSVPPMVSNSTFLDPLMISKSTLLDCCTCIEPLSIPVFQCDNGHIICSTCCPERRNLCPKCFKLCKAIENTLLSMEISCPNTKYGCREKISYIGKRKHDKECIHKPCHCPFSGCDFVASSKVLSNHFNHKHGDSRTRFSYGHNFVIYLKSNDQTIVLQEENEGKLFILNNSTMILGNAVSICCISPNSSESEYSYDMLAGTQKYKLKLQSFAKNVPLFTLATLSSGFLMIPFSSSEFLKLEICINPAPMMQIFIKMLNQMWFPLRVKSSDTVLNLKGKILDKEGFPCDRQRVFFNGKQLEENKTLADYNIKEKSIILFCLRAIGD